MDRPAQDLTSEPTTAAADRRPRDLAVLLLAVGREPARARARDQQADEAGGELRRRVLDRLAALDPEPDAIESALAAVVAEFGEPTGPTRGVCSQVLQEWDQTLLSPDAWGWLLASAIETGDRVDAPRRGKRRPSP